MSLRFAELFAGAGGLSMGFERAGWSCVWHAEIADAPRAILSHRWPDVPLYGDVTTLDGRALTATHGPIDLLTGGSPCQDLSVAGKRAGFGMGGVITEEMRNNEERTRSSLFFEQMRLWDETGADLCLWENVDGARSSNAGKDFGAVLSAFVGGAVPVPADGWRSAGVAAVLRPRINPEDDPVLGQHVVHVARERLSGCVVDVQAVHLWCGVYLCQSSWKSVAFSTR